MSVVSLQAFSSLPQEYQQLALSAKQVAQHSYCPYSLYNVGAALLHEDGSVTTGTNWETCTHQSTCAERCAIVSANAKGYRTAKAIAVYGYSSIEGTTPPDVFVTPCGLCRQMINEVGQLSGRVVDVVMCTTDLKKGVVVPLTTLLPDNFGPSDIGVDVKKWKVAKKSKL
eukprot:PhF_6_TR43323/c0_g1_i2/m.66209/K01489/cdd, CDA; cytidine deaminase